MQRCANHKESTHHQNMSGHWKNTYQVLYNRTKNIIKKNVTMAFYNEKKIYIYKTDASGIDLVASLLQQRRGCGSHGMKHPTV